MTRIVQIIADCFICGHPIFLRHLRSIFNFKQSLTWLTLKPTQPTLYHNLNNTA